MNNEFPLMRMLGKPLIAVIPKLIQISLAVSVFIKR